MMNEKQIYRRMNECWEGEFGHHNDEAEWYGSDDPKEWECYIPSITTYVKLIMDEEAKSITIYECPSEKKYEPYKPMIDDYKRCGVWSW